MQQFNLPRAIATSVPDAEFSVAHVSSFHRSGTFCFETVQSHVIVLTVTAYIDLITTGVWSAEKLLAYDSRRLTQSVYRIFVTSTQTKHFAIIWQMRGSKTSLFESDVLCSIRFQIKMWRFFFYFCQDAQWNGKERFSHWWQTNKIVKEKKHTHTKCHSWNLAEKNIVSISFVANSVNWEFDSFRRMRNRRVNNRM